MVNTLVPTTYSQLSRMFLRWDRSYIGEGFSFARFMFTRYREKNRVLPIVTFFVSNLRFVLVAVAVALYTLSGNELFSEALLALPGLGLLALLWPLTRLGETLDLYQRAMASTTRVMNLLDTPAEITSGPETLPVAGLSWRPFGSGATGRLQV